MFVTVASNRRMRRGTGILLSGNTLLMLPNAPVAFLNRLLISVSMSREGVKKNGAEILEFCAEGKVLVVA